MLVIVATGVLQQYWVQYAVYAGRPRLYVRWFYLFVLAEVAIVLPWAAVRGATVWRRMQVDGHLEEYRRTRLSPWTIVLGALYGSLKPVAWFLLVSAGIGLLAALVNSPAAAGVQEAPTALQTLAAHASLMVLATFFAALGQLLVGRCRYPSLAVPLCVALLAAALAGAWFLNPLLRDLSDPDRAVWWALLPNPAAAVGTLLQIDLLRSGWVYDQVRAVDYLSLDFQYPAPGLTMLLYGALAALCLAASARRLERRAE